MCGVQLARGPLLHGALRDALREHAMLSVRPTQRGIKEIDESHACYRQEIIEMGDLYVCIFAVEFCELCCIGDLGARDLCRSGGPCDVDATASWFSVTANRNRLRLLYVTRHEFLRVGAEYRCRRWDNLSRESRRRRVMWVITDSSIG
ncbi:unnamed protein product [Parnassius apollo]|uniref:(apollo) hypothetical protein n=1 Tax=Parnassius apollo TaxID=110799 RepID=A0A8S3XXD5_PARAO|nr:unnamed protein product [Parnassius apollo]